MREEEREKERIHLFTGAGRSGGGGGGGGEGERGGGGGDSGLIENICAAKWLQPRSLKGTIAERNGNQHSRTFMIFHSAAYFLIYCVSVCVCVCVWISL